MPDLRGSINTNKTNVGDAERIISDRIQNPDEMTCPLWSGQDLAGRQACAASFLSKTAGCNSAEDRIFVENGLRPQYINYVTLSASGIDMTDRDNRTNNLLAAGADAADAARANLTGTIPRFGTSNADRIRNISSSRGQAAAANAFAGQDTDAAISQESRRRQATIIGQQSQKRIDRQRGVGLPNPNGDYMARSTNTQGYVTLKQYP